ncbi:MAG: hypothetical protein CMF55_02020 [Legionellales bacterium]|nr:hypothetical protein [Legionellales bacterium]
MRADSKKQDITVDRVSELRSKVDSKKEQFGRYLKENYKLVTQKEFYSWLTQISARYNLYAKKYALLHPLSIILQQVSQVDTLSQPYINQRDLEDKISGYMQLYILSHCLWLMLHSFPKICHEEGMRIADFPATDSSSPFRQSSETGQLIRMSREIVLGKMSLLKIIIEGNDGLKKDTIHDAFKQAAVNLPCDLFKRSVDDCLRALIVPIPNKKIPILVSAYPLIEFKIDKVQLSLTISGHSSGSASSRNSYSHKTLPSKFCINSATFVSLFSPQVDCTVGGGGFEMKQLGVRKAGCY